ncbi:ATP-binding protein [Methylocystis rosea]|uniref:ATP-binding protein n=1 Tax=Methylocystis rosea TaxID=173366 RepID=UPI00036E3AF3
MLTETIETVPIRSSEDIVRVRQKVRFHADAMGMSLIDQTKIITAASEIARNTFEYGGGGELLLEILRDGARRGLRVTFSDEGPGIADIEQAMSDHFTTGGGLGLGLGGAKRLVNEFDIKSQPGEGTRISLIRWK